jgi:NAD(P)-dependent dehydrogenase (short-subunit alcohol dehydrogenase family)
MGQAMTSPKQDLAGRTAIVTGAGKGLGRAYALHLASRGAAVLVNNRRHAGESDAQTSAMQTVDAIRAAGGAAEAEWSDVSDDASGNTMVAQALRSFGRLDIVVANAGIDRASSFYKQSMADFRAVFDVGFFGNLYLAHAAWPHLVKQAYGRVILTASSAGLYANHGMAAYSSSKAAVIGLMRTLAIEGRKYGVLANVISPYGYSQMTAPHMSDEMQRDFDPSLVAPLVGWLASEACDVSGEVLVSGAGLVRRASIGESEALLLETDRVGAVVHALAWQGQHSHASAVDSFAQLQREHAMLVKGAQR